MNYRQALRLSREIEKEENIVTDGFGIYRPTLNTKYYGIFCRCTITGYPFTVWNREEWEDRKAQMTADEEYIQSLITENTQ